MIFFHATRMIMQPFRLYHRHTVHGIKHIPKRGPVIVVINHFGEVGSEFHISILNHYDIEKDRDVVIREHFWEDGNYMIVVRFHKPDERWVVLESLRYPSDAQF